MSKLGVSLRDWLVGLGTAAGARVHESHVPQQDIAEDGDFPPYIWFNYGGFERIEETLGEVGAEPSARTYDVECWAFDQDTATEIAEAIMEADGVLNALDLGRKNAIFVDDQASDYVPRGLRTDTGAALRSLVLEIHVYGGCQNGDNS